MDTDTPLSDGCQPFVPLAANGPWIITTHGAVGGDAFLDAFLLDSWLDSRGLTEAHTCCFGSGG